MTKRAPRRTLVSSLARRSEPGKFNGLDDRLRGNDRLFEVPKNAPFRQRLAWAWRGIRVAYRDEHSFRSQTLAAAAAVLGLLMLRPGWLWAALLVVLVGLVLMAELFNTALEAALDCLHPEQSDHIRKAKDCAAGAVLVTSLVALAGGVAILIDVLARKA